METSAKKSGSTKADVYISFNVAELEGLRHATFEAIGLYLLLKQKANFQTGKVGTFRNQRLSYAEFARLMCRYATQGREAVTYDSTDIKRLLAQLEVLKMVEAVEWDGQRLTMMLPLSPLWKGNPAMGTDEKLPRQGKARQNMPQSQSLTGFPAFLPHLYQYCPLKEDQHLFSIPGSILSPAATMAPPAP